MKEHSSLGRQYSMLGVGLVAVVIVVALNLRPVLTSVGPITGLVQEATGLDTPAMGLLASVPVLCMGLGSLVTPRLIKRTGMDGVVVLGLLALGVFTVVRSFVPGVWLWIGTVGIGLAIGVLNTVLPPIIKRDFPTRSATITGFYSGTLTLSAGISSGVAVPLAGASSWRVATGIWVVFVVIGLAAWAWSMGVRGTRPGRPGKKAALADRPEGAQSASLGAKPDPETELVDTDLVTDMASSSEKPVSVWRSGLAWTITGFMGIQSLLFYLFVQWLPKIEHSHGVTEEAAGLHMTLFQIAGLVSTLGLTAVQGERADQRLGAVATSLFWAAGLTGSLLAPDLAVVWAMVMGAGSGASFALALSFISTRTRHSMKASRLSGMSQSFGYVIASFGPTLAGMLGAGLGWNSVLIMSLGLSGVLLVLGLIAGADRKI